VNVRRLPDLPAPPDDYLCERGRRGILWVRRESAAAVIRAGFAPDSELELEPSEHSGRRPLDELVLGTEGGGRCLVRRYSHGGLMRWLTGRRFLDPTRPFAELRLSETLRERGVPTPQVVAARACRAPILGWKLDLVTREVADAGDLATLFSSIQRGELGDAPLARLLAELGRFLERAHSAGLLHADLQPANLLLEMNALRGKAPAFWILDLDRSRLGAPLSCEERGQNLGRLLRHVQRRQAERKSPGLSRTDFARILVGYEPDRAARKTLWTSIRAHSVSTLFLHRIGWWLERVFGRARSAPRTSHARARSHARDVAQP